MRQSCGSILEEFCTARRAQVFFPERRSVDGREGGRVASSWVVVGRGGEADCMVMACRALALLAAAITGRRWCRVVVGEW